MIKEFNWYAINCISNQEKSFKKLLEHRIETEDLSSFINDIQIPIERNFIQRNDKKFVREKVVLPGYVLINMEINGELLNVIKHTKSFIGFLNPSSGGLIRNGIPEKMNEKEVSKFLNITLENSKPKWNFQIGDRIKIIDGPFSTFNANIEKIYDNKTVDVIFKIFDREHNINLKFEQVTKD